MNGKDVLSLIQRRRLSVNYLGLKHFSKKLKIMVRLYNNVVVCFANMFKYVF